MTYEYQNTSKEIRRFAGPGGTWKYVAPGDVFQTEKKISSSFFKEVNEDTWTKPSEEKSEKTEEEKVEEKKADEVKPKKKKKKYLRKINED